MKLNAKEIKRFLIKTGLFSETQLQPLVQQIKTTHPRAENTLIAFKLDDIQMAILFDNLAQTDEEILEQVKHLGERARILKPLDEKLDSFIIDGKIAHLITTTTTKIRLDQRLVQLYPEFSRSQLAKLIKSGYVIVNGVVETKPKTLVENEQITLNLPQKNAQSYPILFENTDCLVIDKPAGALSHNISSIDSEWTVDDFAHLHSDLPKSQRAIVHRLDRDTSGLIIAAKNQTAFDDLKHQFKNRQIKKTYLAVVEGKLPHETATIKLPIARSLSHPGKHQVDSNGRQAITHYQLIKTSGKRSLIKLTPRTGRTHQLRVHLSHIGCSIVGDSLYGQANKDQRLMLHASKLIFSDLSGKSITVISPTPKEFNL